MSRVFYEKIHRRLFFGREKATFLFLRRTIKENGKMADQKFENLLNISLEATKKEREQSLNLGVGILEEEDIWEIIFKYAGDLESLETMNRRARIVPLLNGYAVGYVPRRYLDELAALPQVEYVEKPKLLYFQDVQSLSASCVTPVKEIPLRLNGAGVITAVIDSGLNVLLPEFQNADGSTRLLYLWDQTAQGDAPQPYGFGAQYDRGQINEFIENKVSVARDISDHGTPVTSLACGKSGVASGSDIIFVKLLPSSTKGFPRTTQIMMGIDYVLRRAAQIAKPVALNISIGNNYGSHSGTSILERYIDDAGRYWKSVICVGSGNEAAASTHVSGRMADDRVENVLFSVANYQTAINLQIWTKYVDEFEVWLILPNGSRVGPLNEINRLQRFEVGEMQILGYRGGPTPYSVFQEIYFDLLPQSYVTVGVWQIQMVPKRIVDGTYNIWLPADAALNEGTGFLNPNPQTSFTIPSTTSGVITVGAYNSRTDVYAPFSGRGGEGTDKPDLVAPGVSVGAVGANGAVNSYTGTSFATPIVTGCAALLMEWGIERGNDAYLYGEKVKAYLIRGARQLPGEPVPSTRVGFGAVCLQNSIPGAK